MTLLNQRYDLGEVLGTGGMGTVRRATDVRLGRTVAVKLLRGGPLVDDVARSRLRSEARLAASIHHPGVAQVFDVDEDASSPEHLPFIVMEHVEGHSLAELLRERGTLPVDQVMSVVVQVAEGLQAAHDAGVVHRDLKPANVMLTPAGRTVLVDFGIAHSPDSEPLTATGSIVGTADYMSPEQASGRPATPQSDLYALGIVAYHCLTGTSPFRRDSPVATGMAHLHDDLPSFPDGTPIEVEELVRSLAAKSPEARPTSAAAVALQAAAIGATRSIDLPATFELPAAPTATAVQPPAAVAQPPLATPAGRRRRRPAVAFAGVGIVVVALALLGMRQLHADDPDVVPSVVGLSASDATARLHRAGLDVRTHEVDVAGHAKGDVLEQSPRAGAAEPDDGAVTLDVVSGRVRVAAADLVGSTYATASARLEKLGLEVARRTATSTATAGHVTAVDRSGLLPVGSTITLTVATAPAAPTRTTAPVAAAPKAPSSGPGKSKGKAKGHKKK